MAPASTAFLINSKLHSSIGFCSFRRDCSENWVFFSLTMISQQPTSATAFGLKALQVISA